MTRKWLVAFVLAASVALISCSPSGDTKLDGRMLQAGKPFSYQIRPLVESDETVTYEATLADGSVLPGWLKFDPATLRFSGVAPAIGTDPQGTTYEIRVVARGRLLKVASAGFAMQVASFPTAVPEIVNPAEELNTFAPNGILRWTQVSGTDAYEVWVYRDAGLTQMVEFSNQLTSRQYQFTKLAGDTTYFVKIYFRIGGSWRDAPSFSLQTVVPVVKARLSNPQEEVEAFSVGGLLRWRAVTGAERYEVWVYLDSNLQTLAEASGPIIETQYRATALAAGRTYYVQVYSRIAGVFYVGDPLPVTVVDTSARARILNPQEELDAFATNGMLRWTAVTGATAYEAWIFNNPSSSEIQESSGSLTTRSYSTRTLQPGTAYYVQVYALVNGQWQVGAPVKITTIARPTIPRLTNAQEQLEGLSTDGTLTWSEVPGATAYEVHLFTNAGLGWDADTSGPTTARSYQVRSLCRGATYYAVVYALVGAQWTNGWALPVSVTQGTSPAACVGAAPVIRLAATPAAVTRRGDGVRIAWSTQFATSCVAADGSPGWAGPKAPSGDEATAGLNATTINTRFTLNCTGGAGTTRAQILVGLKPPTVTVHGQVVELAYDSLYDLFNRRDPVTYPDPNVEPAPWDYQRILSDLNGVVRVDDYDFVLVYTSDEVAGPQNSGMRFTVPAKNIGFDNSLYGKFTEGWTGLQRALYMKSADLAAYQLSSADFGNVAVLVAFHEIAHHWAVKMVARPGNMPWSASDPVAYLALDSSHWSWAYYDPIWPDNEASSIMWRYGPSGPKFNAFDLYLMGLMGYQETRTHALKLRYCANPAVRATCVSSPTPYRTLSVDDLIQGLRLTQPTNIEGDGRRIPDTDPTAAQLSVLIVAISGTSEPLSDRGLNALQRIFTEIPEAWKTATWDRSSLDVGQASDVVPGIWTGEVHDAVRGKTWRAQGLITDDGRTDFGWLDPAVMRTVGEFFGTTFAAGTDATANLTGIAATNHGYTWTDGSEKAQFTFSGTIVPRTSFTGTYTGGGERGTFALSYDAELWERPSSLDLIAGTYASDGGDLSITVSDDGVLDGRTTYGCTFSGAVRVVNPARNYYDVEMNIVGCSADYPDGRYTGLVVLVDSDDQHSNDQFMIGVNNGSVIFSEDPRRVTDGAVASIAIADDSNQEGDPTPMQFVVTLNRAMATPVTVNFVTVAGTATAGVDFTQLAGTVSFPAGATSRMVEIPILDDAIGEPNEAFTVQLSNPSPNAVIVDGVATGTIFDNDGGVNIASIRIDDVSALESAGVMNFTVRLDRLMPAPVTVAYTMVAGTAQTGTDFLAASGTLTIPANTQSATLPVTLVNNSVGEPDETFTVQLSNPSANAIIVDGTAIGTIQDDDAAAIAKISIVDVSHQENDPSDMRFTVSIDRVMPAPVTANFTTVGGTATLGVDVTSISGIVTIPAGQLSTNAITHRTFNDSIPEPTETFTVELSNPSANAVILKGIGVGTIFDDDGVAQLTTPGVWYGEIVDGISGVRFPYRGLVTETGATRFILMGPGTSDPRYTWAQIFGSVPTGSATFRADIPGVAYWDNYWSNGSRVTTVTIDGTVVPQVSWTGTFTEAPGYGTFSLDYQKDIYERPSSLDIIAGSYLGIQTHDTGYEYTVTLTITATGALTGSDTRGCQYTGSVAVVNPARNYYSLNNVSIANCPLQSRQVNGMYSGLAFFDSAGIGTTRLLYMANLSGGNEIWTGSVTR